MYINGKFIETKEILTVTSPFSGEVIYEVPLEMQVMFKKL